MNQKTAIFRFSLGFAGLFLLISSLAFTVCKNDVTKTANQTPRASDYDISDRTHTFDGNPKRVTITPNPDKSPGKVTIQYDGSIRLPRDVGEYTVTFNVAAARGWNEASGLSGGTLIINDNIEGNITPSPNDYEISGLTQIYDGSPKPVVIEPKAGKSTGNITIYYDGSPDVPSAVGEYEVTFNVESVDGWNAVSDLPAGILIINDNIPGNQTPVADDYDISELTFIYDGYSKTVTITPKSGKSTGDVTVFYNGSTIAPSDVGEYTVTIYVAAADGWNPVSGLRVGTLIINNANIPDNDTPVADDYTITGLEQTYDGSPKDVTITPKAGKSTGARTILYNGSVAVPIAAGSYTVTFNVAAIPGWNAANGLAAGTLVIASNAGSNVKYKIYSDGTLSEGYTITNWANPTAFQEATTSGGGHAGTRAMRLPDNGQWTIMGRGLTIRASDAANVDWSTVDALSFWVKGGENLRVHSFGFLDDQGEGTDPLNAEYKGEEGQGIAITNNWQQILIPLPNNTAKGTAVSRIEVFKIWLEGAEQNGKAVYIDDIELVSVSSTLTAITIPPEANNIPTGTVSIASLLGNYKAQYTVDGKTVVLINKTAPNDDNGTVTFANWFDIDYTVSNGATRNGENLTVTGNFTLTIGFGGKTSNPLNVTVVQQGSNQTPVAGDFTISGLEQVYDGSAKPVTITPKADKSAGVITIRYNNSTTVPSAVGTYTVTFNVAAATGWNAVSGLSAGTLTITGQTPVAGDYDIGNLNQTLGNVSAVTITPKANKSSGARTIFYNGSSTVPGAAGSYTVTFNVAAAPGWNAANGLAGGTLTIAANTSSKVKYKIYSDGTLTSGYTITNWANASAFQLATTAGGGHAGTRAMQLPNTGETWGRGLSIRRTGTPAIDWSTVDALSFWVKGSDNVRISSFGFLDDAGSGNDTLNLEYKGESEQGITLTNNWTNYVIPLPAGTAKGAAISRVEVFKIWIVGDQNGKAVYIDDIELVSATKDHAITIPSSANASAGTVAISSLVGNYKTAYTVDGKTVSLFNNTVKFTNWFNITYNVGGSATRNGDNLNVTGNFTLSVGFDGKTSNQLSATVTANQTPVAGDYDISGLTQTWNGSARTVTITPKSGKSSGARTIYYNGSTTAPSAVGTYTVTFNVAAATGWNAANGLSAGTLTIQAAAPSANKGNIVTYHPTYRSSPTNDQLDRLTHLVLFSITPGANATVPMPSGGWANNISDVVNRAHARNVKVIIALGGWGKTGTFAESCTAANRNTFVTNIVNMVNQHNFDGVDIDWEYPTSTTDKANFEEFMVLLKDRLGNKRLSFAIGAQHVNTYNERTLRALDALHLMTYDSSTSNGAHHADMTWAKGVVTATINRGIMDRDKIFFGVPFYGRNSGGEQTYAAIIAPNQAQASQLDNYGGYRYDGIPQIKEKTKFAWDQNIGGIMIWETGQDVAATSQYSLLKAIYDETQRLKGQ